MRIEIKDKNNFMNFFNFEYPNNKIDNINGISIDSRNIMNNDIFFPIKGAHYDGHDFISKIMKNKSIKCFSENKKYKDTISCNSAKNEIIKFAKIWRKKTNAKIIAITGSNGKTTIKELLFHIISTKFQCSKSDSNYNSSIGLPLTFLSSYIDDQYCILELGASFENEIEFLSNIVKPDLAIITNISKAHIGNFKSFNKLIETKNQIFNHVQPNGTIFVNIDDEHIKVPKNIKKNISIISHSINKKADITGHLNTSTLEINYLNKNITTLIDIPIEILHLKNIILSAYAITSSIGINCNDFQNALNTYILPKGRGQIINYKNCQLIDDSYNANPSSMKMGINRLSNLKSHGRKIAVLGDMLELGNDGVKAHQLIGELLNSKKIEIIFTYGKLMKKTYAILDKSKIQAFHYLEYKKLDKMFNSIIKKNDLIYIKGSRSMQLERLYL